MILVFLLVRLAASQREDRANWFFYLRQRGGRHPVVMIAFDDRSRTVTSCAPRLAVSGYSRDGHPPISDAYLGCLAASSVVTVS